MSEERENELRAELDALGVEYDGRWGVEKLEKALAKAQPATVTCEVLRDYWPTDDQSDRVRKGTMVDVTMEAALDGIEAGALRRIK